MGRNSHDLMVTDLDGDGQGKLVIFRSIPYIIMANGRQGDKQMILLPNLLNGGSTPLGLAESFGKALEYVQTLDSDLLLEVA